MPHVVLLADLQLGIESHQMAGMTPPRTSSGLRGKSPSLHSYHVNYFSIQGQRLFTAATDSGNPASRKVRSGQTYCEARMHKTNES